LIIVDTDVLVTAYNRKSSRERAELSRLVEAGEAAITGVIIAEVLRGARSDTEYDDMAEELLAMHFIDSGQAAWQGAARILYDLKRAGQIIPLADAIISAEALLSDSAIYGHDQHFRRVPGLRIHEPQ
jgi:hypothetical protein